MSAAFKVTYEGQEFDIEITREGELIFLDYDIEYDLALCEFGEAKTPALNLAGVWIEYPFHIIAYDLGISQNDSILLAADWAAHSLPIYEKRYRGDLGPRKAIQAVRDFIDNRSSLILIDRCELMKLRKDAIAIASNWTSIAAYETINMILLRDSYEPHMVQVASSAEYAIADASYKGLINKRIEDAELRYKIGQESEKNWQVARFVDVIEAVQSGRKPPPVEEIKIQ